MKNFFSFSGYGSQAVSYTNLTSEDSMSIRSISVDETPDVEVRPLPISELQPLTESIIAEEESTCNTKLTELVPIEDVVNTLPAEKESIEQPSVLSNAEQQAVSLTSDEQSVEAVLCPLGKIISRSSLSLDLKSSHNCNEGNTNDGSNNSNIEKKNVALKSDVIYTNEMEDNVTKNVASAKLVFPDDMCESDPLKNSKTVIVSENCAEEAPNSEESITKKLSSPPAAVTPNSGDDSPSEGTSVVHTHLPPGKVI